MTEVILPTAGACMRPWIWPNGHIHIERCRIDQLRIGDIAVWFDGKNMVSHRVVELDADAFVTRGDSSTVVDDRVRANQLLGRAVRFSRGPVSYRLDGPWFAYLSRVGLVPWARLMAAARRGRDLWKGR